MSKSIDEHDEHYEMVCQVPLGLLSDNGLLLVKLAMLLCDKHGYKKSDKIVREIVDMSTRTAKYAMPVAEEILKSLRDELPKPIAEMVDKSFANMRKNIRMSGDPTRN